MHPRTTNWLFGLIAVAALGFATVAYLGQSSESSPQVIISSASPSPGAPSASPTFSPTPTTSPKASSSPSPSPTAASDRKFSASQALAQPNEVELISEGGSLFNIAQEHSIKVSELAKFNAITDVNKVFVGQKIIVPDDTTDTSYTLLFVLNTARLTKEKQKITSGGTSLYTDPVGAAQTDLKDIYGLRADTPWSKTVDPNDAKTVSLSTSDSASIITATVTQNEDSLWIIKKLVIKTNQASDT